VKLPVLDRRFLYLILFVSVVLPLLFPIGLTGRVSTATRQFHDLIESLGPGDVIILSFDCEAASWPEVGPVARAIAEHAMRKGVCIIGTSFLSEGTALGYELLSQLALANQKTYGEDWVYLGFRPQYVAAMLGMGESIAREYPQDYLDGPTEELPLVVRAGSYHGVRLIVSIADDTMPQYWVEYAGARYGTRIAAGLAAVMLTTFTPYLDSGQLSGLVGGLKGAAEYEQLLKVKGAGTRGMDAQSSAHLAIIALVILGNIGYYWKKRSA
jgi:hypothetical protein